MANHRVGVSKMPNHRSIIELASRANTSLDPSIVSYHVAVADAFADAVLEPEEFVRRWYEVAVAHLDEDQLEDMKTRFTTYARIFFQLKNAYFAARLGQEYDKLLKSSELPVKPWKPTSTEYWKEQAAQAAELTDLLREEGKEAKTSYTAKELREARAAYRAEHNIPEGGSLRAVFFDKVDGTQAVEIKDVDSTQSGGLPVPPELVEPLNKFIEAGEAIEGTPVDLKAAEAALEELKTPVRVLPSDFEDLKINDLRTLAKEWDIPTAELRSKEDYRQAIREAASK